MRLVTSLSLALSLASAATAAVTPSVAQSQSGFSKRPQSHVTHSGSTFNLPPSLRGELKKCTTPSCFSMSFDDGPHIYHEEVSNLVHTAGYNSTFFVNGNNYGCIYDEANVRALRKSMAQGHTICSHTWGHAHMNDIGRKEQRRQIVLLEEALNKTLGIIPGCFRAPYGEANETTIKWLNDEHKLAVIKWSVDSGDSFDPPATVKKQLDLFRSFAPPQQITLLQHEVYERTARQVLPKALKIMAKNGYYPTTATKRSTVQGVGEVFQFPHGNPYKYIGKPQKRDATWTCDDKPPQAA